MKNRKGFTLVEVIVVLVILAILAAILVPSMIGWINKAEQKSMVISCRSCVLASQTLLMESYGRDRGSANVDAAEAAALAEVSGTITNVTWNEKYQILHLTYTEGGFTVEYCALGGCSACANSDYYTVNGQGAGGTGGGSDPSQDPAAQLQANADSAFSGINAAYNSITYTGNVDGVNASIEGTWANALYNTLSSEQQSFLNTVSWSIVKTTYGSRIFFTEHNHGSGSASNVKVYKYDPSSGKYQYTTHGVVNNGKVTSNSSDWSDWVDTMEDFRSGG